MVKIVESLDALEKEFAAAGSKAVLVDFFAEWCGPCKQIAPKLEALAKETPTIVVLKVDVDKAEDIASKYEISAMPTFKVFKNGQQVDEVIGARFDKIQELFAKYK